MSTGKIAVQCCHGSLAFLAQQAMNAHKTKTTNKEQEDCVQFTIPYNVYFDWLCGIQKKIICVAKNKKQILKAAKIATKLGLKENDDFFLIKDIYFTELAPEECDETGTPFTLTGIAFRPLPNRIAHEISRKYQLLE